MAFDGNGNYVRIHNWTQDAANGLDINAGEMDAEDNSIQGAFNITVTRDGQGKMSADFVPSTTGVYSLGTGGVQWLAVNAKSGVVGPPGSGVAWLVNQVAGATNFAIQIQGNSTAGSSNGLFVQAGLNASDTCAYFRSQDGTRNFVSIAGDGGVTIGISPANQGPGTLNIQNGAYLNGVQIFSGVGLNVQSVNYTLALTDQNKCVLQGNSAGSVTVPTNASIPFPLGTIISIYNATNGNITIPTNGDAVRFGSSSISGTRTLAQNGLATLLKLTATIWVITGSGLS